MKTLHELSLIKVTNRADIQCLSCSSKFVVHLSIEVSYRWIVYKNPNASKINNKHPHLMRFLTICPDAVAFINMNIHKAICPCCTKKSMIISKDGEYDKELLLESLDV
jgi:hypothetical protein